MQVRGRDPWGKDPINPLGLYDLDRRIRPVGQPYGQLVAEWEHILPTQSFGLGRAAVDKIATRRLGLGYS